KGLLVQAPRRFKYSKRDPTGRRQAENRLNVLGETNPAEAQSGFQELRADPRIQAHGMGHFLDVGAKFLAKIGKRIRIADFQRQKRIRGVLDQLRAADGGDHEFRLVGVRAPAVVNRASALAFEDRTINFAKLLGGLGVFDANHDSVWMEKILYSRSFP